MLHALSALREVGAMPAIAPIEDLRGAQGNLLEAKDLNELRDRMRA